MDNNGRIMKELKELQEAKKVVSCSTSAFSRYFGYKTELLLNYREGRIS